MCKKRLFFISLILFVNLLFFTNCFSAGITIPNVESDVYIYDMDNAIDDDTENRLNSLLVDLEKKTSVEFVVISVPSLQGMSIEDYSIKLANELGIGKKSLDNGILLLFTKTEKDLGPSTRLEIGKGMEGTLNDSKCGRVLDQYFVPQRNEDKYTEATDYTVRAIISILEKEYKVTILSEEAKLSLKDDDTFTWNDIPLVIRILIWIIGIFMLLVLIIGIFVLEDDGYGGGSFHSGGYHGSSFGGGFGGGHFGGGGASR